MGNFRGVQKASQRRCRLSRALREERLLRASLRERARRRVSGGGRGRQGAPCPSNRPFPDGRGRRRRLRSSVPAVSARHPSGCPSSSISTKPFSREKFSSPEDCKGTWNKSFLKKMERFWEDGIMKLRKKWQKVVEEDGEDTTPIKFLAKAENVSFILLENMKELFGQPSSSRVQRGSLQPGSSQLLPLTQSRPPLHPSSLGSVCPDRTGLPGVQ